MVRTVNILDAARMTASTSRETSLRVSEYFGDAGPFSYNPARKLTSIILQGVLPYEVAVSGIMKIKFEVARKCNLDVLALLDECTMFHGCTFYPLKKISYAVDRDFSLGLKPETVAVVDGIPNLIFLQPRKNPVPWAYNPSFMNRILEEVYGDYFEKFKIWLIDTEAKNGEERALRLVDLRAAPAMSEREFTRRIASLRQAWRLHLERPTKKQEKRDRPDDGQTDFNFED